MEGLGCIYYIYCKETNKGYVGQSVHADHKIRYVKHWEKSSKKTILRNAMKKYGYDAFTTQSLCIVPHSALNNMEAYWAEQLETYIWDTPGGYNMVMCGIGGTFGLKHTDETKLKMSMNKTYKWSYETREKQAAYRAANKEKIQLNMEKMAEKQRGVNKSNEWKENMSKVQLKRYENEEERKKASDMATKRATSEYRTNMSKSKAGISNRTPKSGEVLISQRDNKWRVRKTLYMPGKTFTTLEEAIIYRDSFLTKYKNGTSP
jgi:hypothetical protein